ncbi:LysR family transcriptional regulator [Hydrogenophaga sp.]|uniref:LysR family transcriptional regulator n=1 Tax=Hydrogenophaga sp. TaxID=1904254 RepID=UPI0025BE1831|nr:LysR family transcriptional regulator [Hydrogenophaga sp.]
MEHIAERNLRSVDLNLLVIFDALMVEKNLTKVGERHGLSQPAVSKALNRLRHVFSDPLFIRCDRAMQPTQRARELAGPISIALNGISSTLVSNVFDPSRSQARLRVASIDLYHTALIPSLVKELRQQAPGVSLHFCALDCASIFNELSSGRIDLAFSAARAVPAGFHSAPLWQDHLVTLIGEHFWDRPFTSDVFASASHVVDAGRVHVSPDGQGSSVVDAMLAARGLKRHIALVLPTAAGLPHIVASTDLIATLPMRIAEGLGKTPGVRVHPLPFDVQVTPHLVWHERSQLDPIQEWLRSLVKSIAARLPA